jgi:hypothetical protein
VTAVRTEGDEIRVRTGWFRARKYHIILDLEVTTFVNITTSNGGGDVVDLQVLRRCKLGLKGRSSSWCRRHMLLFAQDGLIAFRPKGV